MVYCSTEDRAMTTKPRMIEMSQAAGGWPQDPTKNVNDKMALAVESLRDLVEAEARRVNEIMELRAHYTTQLQEAESKRIDAIRTVDVAAVATANERATQQATVLANQVSASAEALRTLVASTAAAAATSLANTTEQLLGRISQLEKAQYETSGKTSVSDPALTETMRDMKNVLAVLAAQQGATRGSGQVVGYVIAAGMALIAAMAIIVPVFINYRI